MSIFGICEVDPQDLWIPTQLQSDRLSPATIMVNETPKADQKQGNIVGRCIEALKRLLNTGPEHPVSDWFRNDQGKHAEMLDFSLTSAPTTCGSLHSSRAENFFADDGRSGVQYTFKLFLPHRRLKRKR